MHNIEQEIRELVLSNPKGWSAKIRCNKEYVDYLNDRFPQFKDSFFKLSTKIYWLMNNIIDFPICPTCGNHYGQHMNVDAGGYPGHCSCRCTQLDKIVREKNENTNMRLYGVRNGAASTQAREKYKQHCQKKWGVDNAFQAKEIKNKISNINIDRYGVPNPMQNPDISARARKTFVDRYHLNSPFQLSNPKRSKGEIELFDYITELFNETKVESSNTSELGGLELDIWIPEYRIAIEYDGDYWHSLPDMVKRDRMKNEMCSRKGVKLYRVKEASWVNTKDDVKMIFEQIKRGLEK